MFLCSCMFVVWKFERGMQKVVARHTHRFRGGLVVQRSDMTKPCADVPQEQATDQYGSTPSRMVGTDDVDSRRRRRVMWPPLGYNVILQVPRELGPGVRARWLPGAAPATNHPRQNWQEPAPPAQLAMPERELTVPSAVVQAGGHGGVAAGAGKDPIFCGGCGDALGGNAFCQGCGKSSGK
jgi:hypothetical protein